MTGRISVRVGDKSDIAKLRWAHRPASDAWTIASPIGNEIASIRSDASGAVLRRAGADDERAATFAALTDRLLGAALEPRDLASWLHGAKPDAAADWKVTVDETQQAGTVQLARRITATRADTVVKLVVDSYRPLEE
ncbi:Outer-membrane lipoprotein LolB [Usitatibacter rugosus]|uniref:Outer-membrane lipoprotein LolB n=1 Tax=Usitatibacter rugosus TaxID=2732067 RepID=A0A6M4GQM2_9PROT|nr:outer membrane lipoprotein LolB [Usitatibacter rugosus]QJR09335.1 Outer-membrane lipoprotein LolB [Usitatibacter rugosus]